MTMSYGEKVLHAIKIQCERRNIVVEAEFESVLAHLKEEYGKSVTSMDERELRRVQMGLGESMTAYLEGAKRRGEGRGPWGDADPATHVASAKAGIAIADIEGSGEDVVITTEDVQTVTPEDLKE